MKEQSKCQTCENLVTTTTKFGEPRKGCKATNTITDKVDYDPKENTCSHHISF